MTFKTTGQIRSYILQKSQFAIQKAQEQVFQVIDRFVKEYYSEYDPEKYERTYQLFRSLVKSDIKQSGNGYVAEVYFDLEALDYHMKRVNGCEVPNTGIDNEKKSLEAAAHGSHGGYKSGTAIWDDPIRLLNTEGYNILKKMLIDSGIPVK